MCSRSVRPSGMTVSPTPPPDATSRAASGQARRQGGSLPPDSTHPDRQPALPSRWAGCLTAVAQYSRRRRAPKASSKPPRVTSPTAQPSCAGSAVFPVAASCEDVPRAGECPGAGVGGGFCTGVVPGQMTVVSAEASGMSGSLSTVRLAVLSYTAHAASLVSLNTCTDSLAPAARSISVQASVCGASVIVQFAGAVSSSCQSMPLPSGPAGSGSSMTTPVAVPVPSASLLLAVTVNPICSPAATVSASATLISHAAGHWTVVVASAIPPGALLAVRVASFEYTPHLPNSVALVTCTVKLSPGPRSPTSHSSVPSVIAHAPSIDSDSIVQLTPESGEPIGSGSLSKTPCAVPVSCSSALLTVTVNPI